MAVSSDAICAEYAERGVKLTVRSLETDKDVLVIEADREGLEFLGRLFLAQAESEDCGFQLGPFGAGKALFSRSSTTGLYIHRLHPAKNKRANGRHGRRQKAKAAK